MNVVQPYTCKVYNVLLLRSGCGRPRQLLVFIKVLRATLVKHSTGSLVEFSKKYLIDNICFYARYSYFVARYE